MFRMSVSVLMVFMLWSCAGSYIETKTSGISLARYGSLDVLPIDEGKFWQAHPELKMEAKWVYQVSRASEHIKNKVSEYAAGQWKGTGPDKLIIRMELSEFNPGSKALRYAVGFGAGKGRIGYHVYLKDANTDTTVAELDAYGTISLGVFGGDIGVAYDQCAKAVISYLEAKVK